MRLVVLTLFAMGFACQVSIQESAKLDLATKQNLKIIAASISEAMNAADEKSVRQHCDRAIELMGDQAGLPESADEYLLVPEHAHCLTVDELPKAFDFYIPLIERQKWWRIGLDPSKTNHSLREVATVIEGCLAAKQVSAANSEKLIAIAQEAGDFLIWTQHQAGTGILPFPAIRNGEGRPFKVAEAFYRQAEKNGTLGQVIRNGWVVDDLNDGGLQFDNGLAGVALVRLYDATKDERYKQAAQRAADWAMHRPVVSNWNYNSFSIFLLAETYRICGDSFYLNSAKKKALLGILPGQLTHGPRRGRWADPHNARPPYHYIIIRGLAALVAVIPNDDPELPKFTECLRLALSARNPDFRKGIFNADSSIEALVLVKSLPPHLSDAMKDCETDEALTTLERYAADRFRHGKPAISPGAWGQLLSLKKQ